MKLISSICKGAGTSLGYSDDVCKASSPELSLLIARNLMSRVGPQPYLQTL